MPQTRTYYRVERMVRQQMLVYAINPNDAIEIALDLTEENEDHWETLEAPIEHVQELRHIDPAERVWLRRDPDNLIVRRMATDIEHDHLEQEE